MEINTYTFSSINKLLNVLVKGSENVILALDYHDNDVDDDYDYDLPPKTVCPALSSNECQAKLILSTYYSCTFHWHLSWH